MRGAHAPVGVDVTLPACVTHAYAETHTLKYDVVSLCYVLSCLPAATDLQLVYLLKL